MSSPGLCSIDACNTSQRARPIAAEWSPESPMTPAVGKSTASGTDDTVARSASLAVASLRSSAFPPSPISTLLWHGRSATPNRRHRKSGSVGRRSHKLGAIPLRRSIRAGASGDSRRRVTVSASRAPASSARTVSSFARNAADSRENDFLPPRLSPRNVLIAISGDIPATASMTGLFSSKKRRSPMASGTIDAANGIRPLRAALGGDGSSPSKGGLGGFTRGGRLKSRCPPLSTIP